MYYAEFDTDKIIKETYFTQGTPGVMVEVGGGDPVYLSMSKHFKDLGWRAIIIEPNPYFAKQHRDAGNEIYQCACSNENKISKFTIVKHAILGDNRKIEGLSFSALTIKKEYIAGAEEIVAAIPKEIIEIKVRTLNSILEDLNIKHVDILSIDTEGWELEVMYGLDTKKINCRVIVIENLLHTTKYTEYMESIGYTLDKKINYNYVYTKII